MTKNDNELKTVLQNVVRAWCNITSTEGTSDCATEELCKCNGGVEFIDAITKARTILKEYRYK